MGHGIYRLGGPGKYIRLHSLDIFLFGHIMHPLFSIFNQYTPNMLFLQQKFQPESAFPRGGNVGRLYIRQRTLLKADTARGHAWDKSENLSHISKGEGKNQVNNLRNLKIMVVIWPFLY